MSETEDKRAANQEYCDQNYNTDGNISRLVIIFTSVQPRVHTGLNGLE